MRARILHGDCIGHMKALADAGELFDGCVTDPPYHLTSIVKRFGKEGSAPAQHGTDGAFARASRGFMGKEWDGGDVAFRAENWRLLFDVLKPGAHVLAFSGTRTYHRMACAIEDAGFEVRDQLAWMYGTGFPKSHDVAKGIDKKRDDGDAKCTVALWLRPHVERVGFDAVTAAFGFRDETMARARWTTASQPSTPTWEQWERLREICGFGPEMDSEVRRLNWRKGEAGDAWKSAPVLGEHAGVPGGFVNHRFSTVDRTIRAASDEARNWEGWGTALKPAWEPIVLARKPLHGTVAENCLQHGTGALNIEACRIASDTKVEGVASGRWPANILHDGSEEVLEAFEQFGVRSSGDDCVRRQEGYWGAGDSRHGGLGKAGDVQTTYGDQGSAARFFFSAKAQPDDHFGSKHPTIKPVSLIKHLCDLILPQGARVIDPFSGTGPIVFARPDLDMTLIEREDEYVADIKRRIAHVEGGGMLRSQEIALRKGGQAEPPPADGLFGWTGAGDAA